MNFNFIYGKSYSNLKEECIKNIQIDITDNSLDKVLVITNETFKKEIEIGIRAANIIDPELKIQVSTINELCTSIIHNLGDRRLKLINNEEQLALLVYSAAKVKDELKLYKNLTLDKTFIQLIKSTISSLKKAQITPEILETKLNLINDQLTKDKLLDLITIFKAYIDNSKDKYLDSEDKFDYAIKLLQINSKSFNYNIYLYKLDNASDQEFKFIKAFTNQNSLLKAFIVNNEFNREPSNLSGAFFKTDLFISKLKKHYFKYYDNNIKSKFLESKFQSEELKHLEKNFFNYPYIEFKEQPKDIFLTECFDMEDEIKNLISNIEYLKATGVDLNSITVAVSNLSQYERIIRNAFDKCNISYSVNTNKKLNVNILARHIEILIDLNQKQDNETFLRFLKTGFSNLTIESISTIEKYINSIQISSIEEIDLEELARLKFYQIEELSILLNNLTLLFSNYDKSNTFQEFYKATFEFLETTGVINILKERIDNEYMVDNESESLQTWQSIIRQLDSYLNILNNTEIDKDIFSFLISNTIENLETSIKIDSGGVNIISTNQIKEGLEIVFILGVNEGVIPSNPKTTTIFTERDILALNSIELLLGEDTLSLILSEQFNTYKIITCAKRMLFISFSTVGKDLATMKKSSIISRLKQVFPMIKDSRTLYSTMEHNSTMQIKSNLKNFNLIESIVNDIHLLDDLEKEEWINQLERLKEIENYNTYIENLILALTYNNKAICNDKYTLQSLYYSDTLSVSKLEKYAKCPFAYFTEYGLKVKAYEPTTLKAKHIGIAIHSIIEQFDVRLKKNNKDWDNIDKEYITSEINLITTYLEKRNSLDIFNSSEAAKYYKNKLKELAKTSILALGKHIGNSFFECVGHEINFDDRGSYPPIMIKLPSGKRLKLRGQIDRLDILKTNNGKFLRIIDYKTGKTTLDLTEIFYGTQLQLLTYLDAIIDSGEENEYLPVGVFYFKIDDPYIKAKPNTSDEYILENKFKELRMKGLFTNNENIVQLMDKGIYDGEYNTSLNIQARFKTDGTLTKATPGISTSDLEVLRKHTKELIKEFAYKILIEGDISINPSKYKNKEACKYCKYKGICQFDETLDFNKFNHLIELSKEEVINEASKKVGKNNE